MRHIAALAKVLTLLVAAGMAAAHAEPRSPHARRNVAIVVYEDVEILDFAGPTEVFTAAGNFGAFRVYTVAATHQPILSQGILRVTPDHSVEDAGARHPGAPRGQRGDVHPQRGGDGLGRPRGPEGRAVDVRL